MYHAILTQARACIKEQNLPLAFDLYFQLITTASTPKNVLGEAYFEVAKIGFLSGLDLPSIVSMLNNAFATNENADEIHTFIIDSFICPNEAIFKNNYENSIKTLGIDAPAYADLKIRFLPIDDASVYLYDVSAKFIYPTPILLVGHSEVSMLIKDEPDTDLQKMFQSMHAYTNTNYMITQRMNIYLAYFQLSFHPNRKFLFFGSIEALETYANHDFFEIPQVIFASEDEKEKIQNFRVKSKPLLSICIPTYNRGNRAYALVQELLALTKTYSFEIIVSNNASNNDTVADYEKIKQQNHPRLHYHENESNLGFVGNFNTVLSLSNGDFSMLLSDEDHLNISELNSLFSLLKTQNYFSVVCNVISLKSNYILPALKNNYNQYAFFNLINHTYISGIIFNNHSIKSLDILEKIKTTLQENTLYTLYPHIVMLVLLANEYSSFLVKNEFIIRGDVEVSSLEHQPNKDGLPLFDYARHQNRAKEFLDATSFFLLCFSAEKTLSQLLEFFKTISSKYLYLMNLSAHIYAQPTMDQSKLASPQEIARVYRRVFDECFEQIANAYDLPKTHADYLKQKQKLFKESYDIFLLSVSMSNDLHNMLGQYL